MTSMLADAPRRSQAILGQPQSGRYHAAADVSSADRSGEDLSLKALQLRRSSDVKCVLSVLRGRDTAPTFASEKIQLQSITYPHNESQGEIPHENCIKQIYINSNHMYSSLLRYLESQHQLFLFSHSTSTFPKLLKQRWQRMDGP